MKTHTFRVTCSFVIQYSFNEREVEIDPEGKETDLVPTAEALAELQAGLEASLGDSFAVSSLYIEAGSDDFLGTAES